MGGMPSDIEADVVKEEQYHRGGSKIVFLLSVSKSQGNGLGLCVLSMPFPNPVTNLSTRNQRDDLKSI